MSNSYLEILKQNNVNTTAIFHLYRKSKNNGAIIKFTDKQTGSIVKESQKRTSKSEYGAGNMGAIWFSASNWVRYDNEQYWTNLTHEELLEFDENYKLEKEKISSKEKLQAMSLLMSSMNSSGSNNLENEVIDALINIAGIRKAK